MASERNNGILIGGKRPEYVHSAQGTGLRRILGLPALVFFGLVYMVPLTMFTTYGVVTEITGGRTASAYLITLAAMLFTAFSYSFMVKKYPIAGSAYSYTSLSFGPCVGFLAGWSLLLDYLFLPMINYLLIGLFLNIAFPMVPAWVFVLAAIGLVTVLNVIGISSVAGMSNVIVGAQFVFAVVFVAMAVKHLAGIPSLDLSLPFVGDGSQPGFAPLMAGAAVLCLSFLGSVFQDAESAANEVMLAAGGKFLASFFTAAYVAGAAGSALASQASVSRILYSMGRDGILPRRVFGSLSERFKTPVIAILVVSVISLLAVVIDLTTLASMISFGALVAFSAVNLAVIRSYLLLDGRRAPRDLLRYGLVPAIGLGLTLWLWTSLSALTLVIGLTWFAAGLAYLALHTGGFRRKAPTVTFSEQN
ncbi:TPA: APC family permease [Pseudomonas aeruginosa]|nr:APC family permease [Pseudomonas aeruginosa]